MPQNKFGKGFFGSRPLQPTEITQNRQGFLWKSSEKTGENLEKLGGKAWMRLYSAIFALLPQCRRAIVNWRAIRLLISILRLVLFLAGAAEVRALTKCGCAR
jgi:hypothetical protein